MPFDAQMVEVLFEEMDVERRGTITLDQFKQIFRRVYRSPEPGNASGPAATEDPAAELAAGWDAAGASSTCMLCDDEPAASRDAGCISASIDACSPALNVAKGETSVWCCQKCWGGCNMTGPCPLRVAVSGSSSAGESVVRRFVDCSSCKSAWTAQIDHFSTNSSNRISL